MTTARLLALALLGIAILNPQASTQAQNTAFTYR
jgi:hypothetical protein